MSLFDRSLVYQFIVHFSGKGTSEPDQSLADLVSREVEGTELMGLRLREMANPTFVPAVDGSLSQVRSKTWSNAIWRLYWGEQQLSLLFDARAYADVSPPEPNVQKVAQRVSSNFAAAATKLGQAVDRAFVSVSGQGSARTKDASLIVAEMYMNAEQQSVAKKGQMADTIAQVIRREDWTLPSFDRAISTNLAESAQALWVIGAGARGKIFAATFEVNTAPEEATALDLKEAQLAVFLERGAAFIVDRLSALEAVACRG